MNRLVRLGAAVLALASIPATECGAHGTLVYPVSRVYRIYQSNPANPNFQLARQAVQLDGTLSYYTWNEVSRNVPQAVQANLPPGFDYSPWAPDGQLASGGRVNPNSTQYPRTYRGLDQVSPDWPKTPLVAGDTITVRFLATAPHDPSVWDVWMTKPGWDPRTPLRWNAMQFLGRPTVTFANGHYTFTLTVPTDRVGHHVLWVAWQRNDPVGEVFFSTSDIDIRPRASYRPFGAGCAGSNNRVPTLTNATNPVLGRNLELEIDDAATGSTLYLLLGRRARIPLGAGCTLLATPDVLLAVGPWTGQRRKVVLPIPNVPTLAGFRIATQCAIYDPALTRPIQLALTNGGEATLGL